MRAICINLLFCTRVRIILEMAGAQCATLEIYVHWTIENEHGMSLILWWEAKTKHRHSCTGTHTFTRANTWNQTSFTRSQYECAKERVDTPRANEWKTVNESKMREHETQTQRWWPPSMASIKQSQTFYQLKGALILFSRFAFPIFWLVVFARAKLMQNY